MALKQPIKYQRSLAVVRQNSSRGILPYWRALYTVEKLLLGLEVTDKVDLSVSKLWQCVSSQTLWSLKHLLVFCAKRRALHALASSQHGSVLRPMCSSAVFVHWHMFVLVWVHKVCTLEVHFEVSSSVKHQVLPAFWVETSSLMMMISLSADYEGKGHWKTNPKALYLQRIPKHSNGPFLAEYSNCLFLSKLSTPHFTDMHKRMSGILLQLKL